MDNDYVILIDENGEPYIAHGIGDRAKKALAVIQNYYRDGSPLYVYSQTALRNLQARGNKMVQDVRKTVERADAKIGISAKKQMKNTDKYTRENATATYKYNQSLLGKAENKAKNAKETVKNNAKETLKNVRETAKTKAKKAAKWLDEHDAGITETARYALKRNKVDQEEKDRLHDEMTGTKIGSTVSKYADKEKLKSSAKSAIQKAKDIPGKTAKWLDEHDAGITETARYALNRNKVDQEEKDRLHDEMTSTKVGSLASKIGGGNESRTKSTKESIKQIRAGLNKLDLGAKITIGPNGPLATIQGIEINIPKDLIKDPTAAVNYLRNQYNNITERINSRKNQG